MENKKGTSMNEIKEYDFASEFSKNPGLRFEKITPGISGEKFRDEVLQKYFDNNQKIVINVDGVESSLGASFLSEAFGNIAVSEGIEKFNKIIFFDTGSEKGKINDREMRLRVQEAIKRNNN